MSEKKRKRTGGTVDHRTPKRNTLETPPENITVSFIDKEKHWVPVIASSPGLSLPPEASFKPYWNPQSSISEILLHSGAHPKLDYTAREEASNGTESHLKHYIGVHNPQNGSLQLMLARKLVVRSTLKSARHKSSNDSENDEKPINKMSARRALGLAFGTKKSQKAIHSLTANAISPSKHTSQDMSASSRIMLDPLAEAVLTSMPSTTLTATRATLEAEIDDAKPRPKPNLQATTPAEVYSLSKLVGGEDVLSKIRVKEWIDTVNAGGDVPTRSLYVSRRIVKVAQAGDVKMVRALKFLYLLIEWAKALKPVGKAGKKVPRIEDKDMAPLVEGWGGDLVSGLGERFAENGKLNKWHQDNLLTHILALTLLVDNYTVDTCQIQYDVKLEAKVAAKYYRELGCHVTGVTKGEQEKMKISRAEAQTRKIARLKLPLEFPKQRVPIQKRK